MKDQWGGAQWVLITAWIILTLIPIGVKLGGLNKKSWPEFIGWWLATVSERATLATILYWGGFW